MEAYVSQSESKVNISVVDEHLVLNREFDFLTCHFVQNLQKVLYALWIDVFNCLLREKLLLVLDPNLSGSFIFCHY